MYNVVGLMSGTSLDGVDLCLVTFLHEKSKWNYSIKLAETVEYSDVWKTKLANATLLSSEELISLDIQLGDYFGKIVGEFVKKSKIKIDFVSSHGHTIFHQPQNNFTFQAGNGNAMAIKTKIPVINNFRLKDVLLGGQGAPLVPIGDELLFSEYDVCINFGGIANLSFKKNNQRIAFDICPVNMALNYLSNQIGLSYDKDGIESSKGDINKELLIELNNLDFYKIKGPKSLGYEWFHKNVQSILENSKIKTQDKLRTFSEHIAIQISQELKEISAKSVLATGGGVNNRFLLELIQSKTDKKIFIPTQELINFKEALIFAFLGVLRWENQINVLKSVTGAKENSCSGDIHYP